MSNRSLYWSTVLAIIVLSTVVRLIDPGVVARLRFLAFDTFQQLSPRQPDPSFPVRIVDIDERSIEKIGNWPWRRDVLARLVERLSAMGARVIGFDIIFPDAQLAPLCRLAGTLPKSDAFTSFNEELKAYCAGDDRLSQAVASRNVVLGVVGRPGKGGPTIEPRASFAFLGDDPRSYIPTFAAASSNLQALQKSAAGLGALNWFPEHDQIVRRVPLLVGIAEEVFPSLSAEMLRLYWGASTIAVSSSTASGEAGLAGETGITSIAIGTRNYPTDMNGQVWLSFTKHEKQRFVSAVDVLDGKVPRSDIDGRIILIGTSAPGLFDLRSTPLDVAIPGVEVHAQALEQLLANRPLLRPDYSVGMELAFMIIAALVLAFFSYSGGALIGAVLGAFAVTAVFATAYWFFSVLGLLLDPIYPSLTLTAVYLFSTAFFYFQTERDRNRVRLAFSHYMAPSLVEQLTRQPERLQLGGETRELTIMFSDVRGFTRIAESYRDDPAGLTTLMNRMLSPLTKVITDRFGTIDKYIGDAIMAFWNAPLDDAEHARHGCLSALEMLDSLAQLNDAREREARAADAAFTPLRLGIGIATGVGMVGNMGSDLRFDYSVLGDTVNLASRLEGLTRTYGVPILLSDATRRQGTAGLAAIEVDRVQVHGRDLVEPIWALLGDEEVAGAQDFQTFSQGFADALALYRRRDWPAARKTFEDLRAPARTFGAAGLVDCFLGRIAEFETSPPPSDWAGVTRMGK